MEVCESENNDEEQLPDIDSSQLALSPISSQEPARSVFTQNPQRIDDGIIEKIVLKNFMCHKHLTVDLGTVNFIIGRNGSGKSAILTGIVMGLGGKASSTQRASAMSSFVRSGANEAEISITLRNAGLEAYKPEEYGQSIIVIRQIKQDGGGAYKLKGTKDNHIVANTKDELIRILDHFNIQVDNPVSILSQDTSRNFLHSKKATDKYQLFMKGTHLDQIAHDCAKAEEQQKLMSEEIKRKIEMLPEMEKKAKLLEEEVKEIDCLDNLENKLKDLSLELSWAIVKKLEKKAEKAQKELKEEESKLSKAEDKLLKIVQSQEQKQRERDQVMEEVEEIRTEAGQVEIQREELHTKKRDLENHLKSSKSKGNNINKDIEKMKKEKKEFEDKLAECRNQNLQDLEGEKRQLLDQKEALERELAEKNRKLETARRDRKDKEQEVRDKESEDKRCSHQIHRVRSNINDCEETLKRLESTDSSSLQMFGSWMTEIVRAIERNRQRFRRHPIGPIGSFVKVKDQSWVGSIEIAIGSNTLSGFLVDNQQDGDVLRGIIERVISGHPGRPHPSVYTSSFDDRVYDVSRNIPQCPYPTIMSMVEVSDPDVMNILIDMCNVECNILVRENSEARTVMGRNPPRNVKIAYTMEGDQALPNYRYYSNRRTRPMGILRASVHEAILQQRVCHDNLQAELQTLLRDREQMERSILQLKRDGCKINDYITREQKNGRQLQASIDDLKVHLEEIDATDQQEEDIATWEGIISDLEEKITQQKQSFQQLKVEMNEGLKQLKLDNENMKEHEKKVKAITDRLQETRSKFKVVSDKIDKYSRSRTAYDDKIRKSRANINEMKKSLKKLSENAARSAEETEELGERIDTNRESSSIQIEIGKIEKKLQEEAGRRANHEEIKKKYVDAYQRYKATEESILDMKRSYDKLKYSLNMRTDGHKNIRRRMTNRARLYFQNHVQQRGYEGTLKFDTANKKLDIIVKVDKNQATKNISSLSGGERSFSTVSFIMALWEAIESPFRCLDEFDVFMDLMNRKISMKLMLTEAKNMANRQFIFFTPQDMSALGINLGSYKVLQLQPPDRNQRTLEEQS